uniref:Uncharacterized protein n=1 Tax=Oryza meridionalis TaxID=40149 RepID=A0A0E0ELN8_9ORYZ
MLLGHRRRRRRRVLSLYVLLIRRRRRRRLEGLVGEGIDPHFLELLLDLYVHVSGAGEAARWARVGRRQ